MGQEKQRAATAMAAPEDTFVNTKPNSTGDATDDQPLTATDFLAWRNANADELSAKCAAAESVRAAEKAAILASFTDATIRAVAASMADGVTFDDACESLIGNAFRFGACHETMNELVIILESLGWHPEGAAC